MNDSEKVLQTYAVAQIRKLQKELSPGWVAGRWSETKPRRWTEPVGVPAFLYAGDMAGQARSSAERLWASNTGLIRGEPDLRLYGPRQRVLLIELKTQAAYNSKNRGCSPEQIERHTVLLTLGFSIAVLGADDGDTMAGLVDHLVRRWLAGARPAVIGAVLGVDKSGSGMLQ